MPSPNSSQSERRAQEDTFAHAILHREVVRPVNASVQATVTQPMKTQEQTNEWRALCRAKGWFCGVCGVYPEYGNSLGYEDGLCPVHRLTSHVE